MSTEKSDQKKAPIPGAETKIAAAKSMANKPKVAPKKADTSIRPKKEIVITAEDLIADWDKLYDKLTKYEAQQKAIKKPFRHVVLARNRMNQFRNNFKRNSGC